MRKLLEMTHSEIYSKIKTFAFTASDLNLYLLAEGVYKEQRTILRANSSNILGNPVESIINNGDVVYKCFTFNSFLKPEMDKIKFKLQSFHFSLSFWFKSVSKLSLLEKSSNLFSIHSPNSLPNINDMRVFDVTSTNEFYYNQVNTELLGEGYETNCLVYGLGNKFTNHNMRSDCISA